jgi:mannose-6-phosphate isomerase-like protein (cupin superfamily)
MVKSHLSPAPNDRRCEQFHSAFLARPSSFSIKYGRCVRKVITGVDAEGRSCVVSEEAVAPSTVEGISTVVVAHLFATQESPPAPRPPANGPTVDVQLAPGFVRWMVVEHRAHEDSDADGTPGAMHHSNTVDLIYVLEGTAEFVLEDGAHSIGPGDCIVEPGVDHAMVPGSRGCRLLVVSIGTPPPA